MTEQVKGGIQEVLPSAWMPRRRLSALDNNLEESEKLLNDKLDRLEWASRRDNLKLCGIPEV